MVLEQMDPIKRPSWGNSEEEKKVIDQINAQLPWSWSVTCCDRILPPMLPSRSQALPQTWGPSRYPSSILHPTQGPVGVYHPSRLPLDCQTLQEKTIRNPIGSSFKIHLASSISHHLHGYLLQPP